MNLQYITDTQGNHTGVLIPIFDWNLLKNKYKDLENNFTQIPNWHKEIVNKRINEFEYNSENVLDFDTVINQIENEL